MLKYDILSLLICAWAYIFIGKNIVKTSEYLPNIIILLVIAILLALYIGIPFELVTLSLSIISVILAFEGGSSIMNSRDMAVSGARGVARSILRCR